MEELSTITKLINLNLLYSKNRSIMFIDRKEDKINFGIKSNYGNRNIDGEDIHTIDAKDDNTILDIYNLIDNDILSKRNYVMMYGTNNKGALLRLSIEGDSAPMSIELSSDKKEGMILFEQINDEHTNRSEFSRARK